MMLVTRGETVWTHLCVNTAQVASAMVDEAFEEACGSYEEAFSCEEACRCLSGSLENGSGESSKKVGSPRGCHELVLAPARQEVFLLFCFV